MYNPRLASIPIHINLNSVAHVEFPFSCQLLALNWDNRYNVFVNCLQHWLNRVSGMWLSPYLREINCLRFIVLHTSLHARVLCSLLCELLYSKVYTLCVFARSCFIVQWHMLHCLWCVIWNKSISSLQCALGCSASVL